MTMKPEYQGQLILELNVKKIIMFSNKMVLVKHLTISVLQFQRCIINSLVRVCNIYAEKKN